MSLRDCDYMGVVINDSKKPLFINDGWSFLCNTSRKPEKNELVFIKKRTGQHLIADFVKNDTDTVTVQTEEKEPITILLQEIELIYSVIGKFAPSTTNETACWLGLPVNNINFNSQAA